MNKIVTLGRLKNIIPEISAKKIVLVGGCFDLFHFGHLKLLQSAKKEGDFLIIALESDEFIKKQKDRDPIHSQKQRAEILSSLQFVDLVVELPFLKTDKDYFDLVKVIKPSIIAVTEGDKQIKKKEKQAHELNSKLKVVTNLIKGFSSKKIIKALE